jgi:hypothetical protein
MTLSDHGPSGGGAGKLTRAETSKPDLKEILQIRVAGCCGDKPTTPDQESVGIISRLSGGYGRNAIST